MFKKIILSLFLVFFLFSFVSAQKIKVENIFSDIKSDYKYLPELQKLYDKWIIFPSDDWKFNPNKLLTREEFVWILTEVSCDKCIKPNTSYKLLDKYSDTSTFFDINKNNKYFYCIVDASYNKFINGYDPWTICENWNQSVKKKPFCPNNNIILEEALAIILRSSNILSSEEAEFIRQEIRVWRITEKLSTDIWPKNLDWTVYSFYPDFKKALEYEIVEYDTDWNKIVSKLIEKIDGKIRPKKSITKEEFLRMAVVTLKANACMEIKDNTLPINMKILDKSCEIGQENCDLSNFDDEDNTYDLTSEVWWICDKGITEPSWYMWRFYNKEKGEEVIKYWKFLDNYKFLSGWNQSIYLRITDNCGNTSEIYNKLDLPWVPIKWFWIKIDWWPLVWPWTLPLPVNFKPVLEWWEWPFTCEWDFWDGTTLTSLKWDHIYTKPWTYTISVKCKDNTWIIEESIITVYIPSWPEVNPETEPLWFWIKIDWWPLVWPWTLPLPVNFKPVLEWWEWPFTCEWDFWDGTTLTSLKWDHIYTKPWTYTISVKCKDNTWIIEEAIIVVYIPDWPENNPWIWKLLKGWKKINLQINAEPIYWFWSLKSNLEWIVTWWTPPFIYEWDFWDSSTWFWKKLNHVYNNVWVYKVVLHITDDNLNEVESMVLLKNNYNINNIDIDSDLDNVLDNEDKCPLIKWTVDNLWCPIFEDECNLETNNDCKFWYYCSDLVDSKNRCLPITKSTENCGYDWNTTFFWKAICNSCPCENLLDFNAVLRWCDIVFPAVTSPDGKEIYNKWESFKIK